VSKLLEKLTAVAFCLLAAAEVSVLFLQRDATLLAVARAQGNKPALKSVEIPAAANREPGRILNIMVGKERVTPGWYRVLPPVPFRAGEDWLANLSFTLKNQTSKPIAYLYLWMGFPETEANSRTAVGVYMVVKTAPSGEPYLENGYIPGAIPDEHLHFAPGKELRISLAGYINQIRQVVEARRPISSITKAVIAVHAVDFEDGLLMWGRSGYCTHPPEERGGPCQPLGDKYFPGVLGPEAVGPQQ